MRVAVTGGKASTAGGARRPWGTPPSPRTGGPRTGTRLRSVPDGPSPPSRRGKGETARAQSLARPSRALSPVARSSAATAAAPAVTVS
ncbi:hypothetical protein GCM10010293_56580 [Streptomyces griseoflavus]|nr:hypothetical protein GCM10010293_56580 [Streptomyces griseoflavus]